MLKEHYNYDSTVSNFCALCANDMLIPLQNTFFALYRSFTECVFIEEDGAIVFYKNKHGHSQRDVAEMKLKEIDATWNAEEQDNGVQVIE